MSQEEVEHQSGGRRTWIYAPGANAEHWDEFYEAGLMVIGWDSIGDLSQYGSLDDVLAALLETSTGPQRPTNNARTCFDFAQTIRPGDRVFVKRGRKTIVGYGTVSGVYEYHPERPTFRNVRSVRWEGRGTWTSPELLGIKTLTDVTSYTEFVSALEELVGGQGGAEPVRPIPPAVREPYAIEIALEGLFLDEEVFSRALAIWRRKKNLILQGPPGVGKSFIARRLAYMLMGYRDPSRVRTVQFHQSYSYEDFVQGYRPDGNGFGLKQGVFKEFCDRALGEPDEIYVFVIDEINRGNLSKILGEMMLLIEPDKRSPDWATKLAYAASAEERFYVPPNLFILGMMNTADRSLSLVDYALRRRFGFLTLKPEFQSAAFRAYLLERGVSPELAERIITRMTALNKDVTEDNGLGVGFCIGHSFFSTISAEQTPDLDWYRDVIETEVVPLLDEYWFDDSARADGWRGRLLAE